MFLAASGIYAEQLVLRLGYSDAPAFPFQVSHEADPPGIAFDIIDAVSKDLNIKVEYVCLPNKRVLHALQQGEIDGAFMYSYKAEREVSGQYPKVQGRIDEKKRIATLSYYLYRMKGSAVQWDGTKFSGLDITTDIIGANTGYSIVDDLISKGLKVDDGAKTTEQNFKKLLSKRIIGYAHQDLVADHYIDTNNLKNVEKISTPLVKKSYYLLFSHQFMQSNAELAQKIWNKVGELRDSVTKNSIVKYR